MREPPPHRAPLPLRRRRRANRRSRRMRNAQAPRALRRRWRDLLISIAQDAAHWSRPTGSGAAVALDAPAQAWLASVDAAAAGRWRTRDRSRRACRAPLRAPTRATLLLRRDGQAAATVRVEDGGVFFMPQAGAGLVCAASRGCRGASARNAPGAEPLTPLRRPDGRLDRETRAPLSCSVRLFTPDVRSSACQIRCRHGRRCRRRAPDPGARRAHPQPEEHRPRHSAQPAGRDHRACRARASRAWPSTRSTPRASAATSRACRPTRGSSCS